MPPTPATSSAAVNFAREDGLDLAVRGGGHSVPGFGTSDGGVVVDLSGMRGVRVDPATQTARAEGGATWGDFNAATDAFGLATTGGIISTTGVGGLTLGGGIGYLSRGLGLSLRQPRSADVVTADGRFLVGERARARGPVLGDARRRRQLRRGDVARVRLAPVEATSTAGRCSSNCPTPATCCGGTASSSPTRPEEFGGFPAFQIAPPLPFIPEERHGDTFLAFVVVLGRPAGRRRDDAEVAPRRRAGGRRARRADAVPRAQQRVRRAGARPGSSTTGRRTSSTELTDDIIDAHLVHGPEVPVVNSTMHIYPINGAVHRVAPGDTAFATVTRTSRP